MPRNSNPTATLRAGIIGGGIGGLTAAIALEARGFRVTIFEAAQALRPVGAGLMVSPNAMQLLHRLGLSGSVIAAGSVNRAAELYDAGGRLLQRIDLARAEARYGVPSVTIHRHRLHEILLGRISHGSLRLSARVNRIDDGPHGAALRMADGCSAECDVVVGADGLQSSVRHHVAPHARVRYSGQTSWRGIASFAAGTSLAGLSREIWAPGRRFGFSPVSATEVYWFATSDSPPGVTPAGDERGWLATGFAGFPSPVPQLIDATSASHVVRTDMYDVKPFAGWSRGRVVLLGDAAHATTPNLGQGAAQAIEDAWVLADRLARDGDHAAAFEAYERMRRPKTRYITTRSYQFGRLAHLSNPIGRAVRNLAFSWTPESVTNREMDRIFTLGY